MARALMSSIVVVVLGLSGCLVTGQVTLKESVEFGATTDDKISKYDVDLNDNSDYAENKDKIITVDEVSLVAFLENREGTAAVAEIFISDNANLATLQDIRDPDKATRVFVSPTVPPNSSLIVKWEDGFAHVENTEVIINQVLGDGIFTLYAIAKSVPFDLFVDAEVVVTITVEE